MSERPFMQLYVSDFIGDTLHLSTEQIGAYMLMLMAMWNAGGKLPSDDAKLARVTRMSVKKWKSISADLMPFFVPADGTITHNRLTKELRKSESKSQSRAAAGADGGRAKALKENNARMAIATAKSQHLPDTITREDTSSLRSDVSSEPDKSAPTSPTVIELPALQGDLVAISQTDVSEWVGAFPAVNVDQKLKAIRAWLIANPKKRKTARGMKRFVVSWLSREQDRGGGSLSGAGPPNRETEFARNQRECTEALERRAFGEKRNDEFASNGPAFDLEPRDWRPH